MNARNFEATETSKSGVTVRARAIQPADKAGIVKAFGKLDSESIYTRFFQLKQFPEDGAIHATLSLTKMPEPTLR
jgi:hypothetical protein